MTASELYTTIYPIQDPELRTELIRRTSRSFFRKGQMILPQADKGKEILFLGEGIARGFILDSVGRDITIWFNNVPGDIVTGSIDLGLAEDSVVNLEMLTEGDVLSLALADLAFLQDKYQEVLILQNRILATMLERHWTSKLMLYKAESREKYSWFLKEYPGLIEKVSHKKIASFLGMSPVTLSRIRHRKD